MGRVPGATSWPTAVVEILVPSQAAACDICARQSFDQAIGIFCYGLYWHVHGVP